MAATGAPTRRTRAWRAALVTTAFALIAAACGDSGSVAGDSSTTSDAPATSGSQPDTTTTTAATPTSEAPATSAPASTTAAPPGPSEDQLTEIGVVLEAVFPRADYEVETGPSNTVAFYGFGEDGARRETPAAILAANGGEAASDGVLITNLSPGMRVASPFEIAGRGRGFEATLDVRIVTPAGAIIASTFTGGGPFAELEPFSIVVDTGAYEGPVYVVVASGTGIDEILTDFAFVRIEVRPGSGEVPVLDETAAVVRVTADDVLNVRSDPDAGSTIVAELAPDATGINVLSRPDGLGGWWLVEAPDGTVGWSSAAFLVLEVDIGPAEEAALRILADDVTSALSPFQATAAARLPWTTRFATVAVGWPGAELESVSARRLRDGSTDVWTVPRRWPISEQFDPPYEEVDLVEFLRLLPLDDPERAVDIDLPWVYGALDDPVVTNLPHVAITDPDVDGSFWRTVRIHVDLSAGSPEIAAITVEHWDP